MVDPFLVEDASTCEEAVEEFPYFPDAAVFEAPTGLSPRPTPGVPGNARHGRLLVQVFDQGEPGGLRGARSPGTASPSNSLGAPTPPTPGEVTSRAAMSRSRGSR